MGGQLQSDNNVCFYTDWTGDNGWDEKPAIYIGGSAQIIGQNGVTLSTPSVETEDNVHLTVGTGDLYVAEAHKDAAGVYSLTAAPGSFEALVANIRGKLSSTALMLNTDDNSGRGFTLTDNTMTAALTEDGVHQVYAKLRVVYGGKLTDQAETGNIVGGGAWCNFYLFTPVTRVNNQPVTTVRLTCGVPVMAVDGTLALKSATFPYTALNNSLTWESSDEETATVSDSGIVTALKNGTVAISATAPSGVSDSVTITCVAAEISGADHYAESGSSLTYEFTTEPDELPEGCTVQWRVGDNNAYITEEGVLYRNTNSAADVTITAALIYNGKATGITANKIVSLEKIRNAIALTAVTADNAPITSGSKTNQAITLTAEGEMGKTIIYTTDDPQSETAEWKNYTDAITVSTAEGTTLSATYTFRYNDRADEQDRVSFAVDFSRAMPSIEGVENGKDLPVNTDEDAASSNSITLPEGIAATLDGDAYTSGADISGGEHEIVLTDAYGNTAELTVTVPVYTVSWSTPDHGIVQVQTRTSDSLSVTRGGTISVLATPDEGYVLQSLTANGSSIQSGDVLTVSTDLTIEAAFALKSSDNNNSGGNGGSNSNGSNATGVTVPVSSNEGSVSVSASVSNGTASIAVTDTQLGKVISNAAATGTVTVDVSGLKNVDSAKIPAKLLTAANGTTGSNGLEVVLPTGIVKLDNIALASVAAEKKDITVSVEEVKTSALTTTQKEVLGDKLGTAVVVDVNILVNGVKTSNFNGGTLTISVPYTAKAGEDTSKLTVWYIKDDGTIENKGGHYDSKNKSFVFETTHLSQYVLVSHTNANPFTDVSADGY